MVDLLLVPVPRYYLVVHPQGITIYLILRPVVASGIALPDYPTVVVSHTWRHLLLGGIAVQGLIAAILLQNVDFCQLTLGGSIRIVSHGRDTRHRPFVLVHARNRLRTVLVVLQGGDVAAACDPIFVIDVSIIHLVPFGVLGNLAMGLNGSVLLNDVLLIGSLF